MYVTLYQRILSYMSTFCAVLLLFNYAPIVTAQHKRKFSKDFLFGTTSTAFQGEGAWNKDGKGESIWDHLTHTNRRIIKDRTNADISCDTYHKYKRDVEMMRELGVNAHSLSMSWSRILPTGFDNKINKAGIAFYKKYIDEMYRYNITPIVTLYHWDLPRKLQNLGGWVNPLIEKWFGDYARVVFENFGKKVKHWITISDPRAICYEGYGNNTKAPRLNARGVGEYLCAKNLLMAHARAYNIYKADFKGKQGGMCGIAITVNWFEPATESAEDKFAAELKRQFEWGIYASPIFSKNLGFPKEMVKRIANKCAQKHQSLRLPKLSDAEKRIIHGTADFFGVNQYTSNYVSANERKSKHPSPSMLDDVDVGSYFSNEWPKSASSWLQFHTGSLIYTLTHLTNKYGHIPIYVMESGWSTSGLYEDETRIVYMRSMLSTALDALDQGVKLKGFMARSLMDSFEWLSGYTEKFGLYEVNFEDSERTRTPRKSAFVYKDIIYKRYVDYGYSPHMQIMSIDKPDGHIYRDKYSKKKKAN